jgi:hypothetical protein
MKTEQERLAWRFIGYVVAIAVVLGLSIVAARWIGPLGS